MAYKYDIFVSYRHDDEMADWVHKHFRPFLESFVGQALNRKISLFVDRDGIAGGDVWPAKLHNALACSRAMVAVWNPLYFDSPWCRRECASMMYREAKLGYGAPGHPKGLVVPVKVFDGEYFPDKASARQCLDCRNYWVVGEGFTKTEGYVTFQQMLQKWAPNVAAAVHGAPAWQADWLTDQSWFAVPDGDLFPKSTANFSFTGLE